MKTIFKSHADFTDPGTEETKLIADPPPQSIALPEIGKTPPYAPQPFPPAQKLLWGSPGLRPLEGVPCFP